MTSLLCAITSQSPLVITFRGSDLVRAREVPRLRAWLGILCSQLSALFAHSIICTGDRLRDRLWWRKKSALVLPSGVNLGLFRPSPQAMAQQALGWSPDQKVVLFNSGGLPLLKGRELAQQAVSIAENYAGPMRFVELKGEVSPDQMPLYLNAADCLVLASESEGSPNIVKEALACNLPIAAVDVGDVAERLRDVNPSRVVHRDAHELGMAIADILAQQKRSNGRNKVAEFADDRIAAQLKIIYQAAARISRNGQQH